MYIHVHVCMYVLIQVLFICSAITLVYVIDYVAVLRRSCNLLLIFQSSRYNEGVHIVPDSLGFGGDSNSTVGGANHKHSQPSSEVVALSPSITQISETPPRNLGLGTSACDPGLHVGISPHNSAFGARSFLHNSDSGTSPHGSNSGASPHNLDSTKYYSGEELSEGKTPKRRLREAYTFAAALLDSTDDEEEEEGILPAKDGEKFTAEKLSSSDETKSLSTSSKGETSTSSSISPPLQFDSGKSAYIYMYTHVQLVP